MSSSRVLERSTYTWFGVFWNIFCGTCIYINSIIPPNSPIHHRLNVYGIITVITRYWSYPFTIVIPTYSTTKNKSKMLIILLIPSHTSVHDQSHSEVQTPPSPYYLTYRTPFSHTDMYNNVYHQVLSPSPWTHLQWSLPHLGWLIF